MGSRARPITVELKVEGCHDQEKREDLIGGAVLQGGVVLHHPELKPVMWT
jgi:hypothetical protein